MSYNTSYKNFPISDFPQLNIGISGKRVEYLIEI